MDTSRRSQSDRTAATRAALIGASVDSLIEVGWAATTSVEVCRRAGVTRGALVHHFGGLPDLLAAALHELYTELAAGAIDEVSGVRGLLDATWARIGSPRFKAVLEAWLAATNDRELGPDLVPVILGFAKLVNPRELADQLELDDAASTFYLMAREAMLGLALGRATSRGEPVGHEAAVIELLRAQADGLDAHRDGAGRRG